MEINEIEILSVGVDVGSSTSHLVFSNLVLKRDQRSIKKNINTQVLIRPISKPGR
jgi:ethanolamine utilization protein EutA